MDKRVDFADDNLPAADQARVKVGRLVDPLVVVVDQLLVLDRVLREDFVPCKEDRERAESAPHFENSSTAPTAGTHSETRRRISVARENESVSHLFPRAGSCITTGDPAAANPGGPVHLQAAALLPCALTSAVHGIKADNRDEGLDSHHGRPRASAGPWPPP